MGFTHFITKSHISVLLVRSPYHVYVYSRSEAGGCAHLEQTRDLELLLPCTVFETRASSLVRSRESARGVKSRDRFQDRKRVVR